MTVWNTWYFVRYRLYDINNAAHFATFSQYKNWSVALEKAFGDNFEIVEIYDYNL